MVKYMTKCNVKTNLENIVARETLLVYSFQHHLQQACAAYGPRWPVRAFSIAENVAKA